MVGGGGLQGTAVPTDEPPTDVFCCTSNNAPSILMMPLGSSLTSMMSGVVGKSKINCPVRGSVVGRCPDMLRKANGGKSKVRMRDQAHEHKARSLGAKWRRMIKFRVRTDSLLNPILAV